MPRDANGVYSLPGGYRAVTGQTIMASQHNPPLEDLAESMTNSLPRNGAAPMAAPLDMGGFKVSNMAEPSSSGDAATKAYIDAAVAALTARLMPVGAVQGFDDTTAPTGWVKRNGGTIGNAASGGTTRANADTEALFTHLWTKFDNTKLPIQTSAGAASTRGASAAADFAANKRMPLFDSRTRFHRGSDDGLAFDATLTVGASQADVIKNHLHPGNTTAATGKTLGGMTDFGGAQTGGAGSRVGSGGTIGGIEIPSLPFTTDANTSGSALETRPRSSVLLYCIKL